MNNYTLIPETFLRELTSDEIFRISRFFYGSDETIEKFNKPMYAVYKGSNKRFQNLQGICLPAVPFFVKFNTSYFPYVYLVGVSTIGEQIWTFDHDSLFQPAKPLEILRHRLIHEYI